MNDVVIQTSEGTLLFWCPGCRELHGVWLKNFPNPNGAWWYWNGSKELPTFTPSVLVHGSVNAGRMVIPRCHSYVRDGRIQFLSDCEHDKAGQTVMLPKNPLDCHA